MQRPSLSVGTASVVLPLGPSGGRVTCGPSVWTLPQPGSVACWAAVGADALLVGHDGGDDRLVLLTVPGLVVLADVALPYSAQRIAVAPDASWAAVATGCSGNYATHGELLRVKLPALTMEPLRPGGREVLDCAFVDASRLHFVLGCTDEGDCTYHEGWLDLASPGAEECLRVLSAERTRQLDRRPEPC